jgi:hypothetical protein
LFAERGLALGSFAELSTQRPDAWIVVILGDAGYLARLPFGLRGFVEQGGSVLIATDRAAALDGHGISARFHAGPVRVPRGPDAYRDRPTCPIVRSLRGGPLFTDVTQLAFNVAGWLSGQDVDSRASAFLPISAIPNTRTESVPPAVIAAMPIGRGRLLLVADQTLFANEMFLELDNLAFARNSVEWLRADRDPARCKVHFVEEGFEIDQWIDPRFESGEWSTLSAAELIDLVNRLLTGFEDENVHNEIIASQQSRLHGVAMRQLMLIVPSIALAVIFAVWILRARSSIPATRSRTAKTDPAASHDARADVPVPVLALRRDELVKMDNFAEPARQMAHEFLVETIGDPARFTRRPNLRVHGNWWTRVRARYQLRQIWRLATSAQAPRISARQFCRLSRSVARLRQLHYHAHFGSDPD